MRRGRVGTALFLLALLLSAALYFLAGRGIGIGLLAASLAVYAVFAAALALATGRKLKVKIRAPGEQKKGQEGISKILLCNESRLPVLRCDLLVCAENRLTGAREEMTIIGAVFSKRTRELPVAAGDSCCGMLQYNIRDVRVSDPLGVFFRSLPRAERTAATLILPDWEKPDLYAEQMEHYDMESFRFAEGRVGTDSSETVGLRAYQPGDSVRSIHWKLSAKTDSILLREAGLPVDSRWLVMADRRIAAPDMTGAQMGRMAEAGLSISMRLLEMNITHTLAWYDARKGEYIARTVACPDDVYRLAPEVLDAPWRADERSVIERFLASDAEKAYAGYLIVTPGDKEPDGTDILREYGYVSFFVPKTEEKDRGGDR